MRREVLGLESKSEGVSLTPSTSVEVYTVILNISRRFAGSRRYGLVFVSERFSMASV